MSAALTEPEPFNRRDEQFGPCGPQYGVLGDAEPAEGKARVRIVLVRTGENVTYCYEAMLEDPEPR